jgi:hypothetical protein
LWRDNAKLLAAEGAVPWELIDAAFAARRRDAKGVRACLTKLADRPAVRESQIWRDRCEIYVPLFLRGAGDPEWQTWRPKLEPVGMPRADRDAVRRFHGRFWPGFLDTWDYDQATPLPGTWLQFPASIRRLGESRWVVAYPRVEFMVVVGDTAWFTAPMLYDRVSNAPHHLVTVPIDRIVGHGVNVVLGEPDITRIPWPLLASGESITPRINCWTATTTLHATTVWIGTRDVGLARFDQKDGEWHGRWYAAAEGLPQDIMHVGEYRVDGQPRLLVAGFGPKPATSFRGGKKTCDFTVSTVDPATHAVRLLLRTTVQAMRASPGHVDYLGEPVLRWPSGERIPLRFYGTPGFPGPTQTLSLEEASAVEWPDDPWSGSFKAMRSAATSRSRLWHVGQEPTLQEWDAQGKKPHGRPVGHVEPPDREEFESLPDVQSGRPAAEPLDRIGGCAVVDDMIWLILDPTSAYVGRGGGTAIVAYRPTPPSTQRREEHDRWAGPYAMPDKRPVFSLRPDSDGRVWITGTSGVLLASGKDVAAAAADGMSTADWQQSYAKRLALAPWRVRIRAMLADHAFDDVLALLDQQSGSLPASIDARTPALERDEWTDLQLYRVLTLAYLGRSDEALALADRLRTDEVLDLAARRHAAGLRIQTLAHVKRWQNVLDAIMETEGALDDKFPAPWSDLVRRAQEAVTANGPDEK